MIDILWNSKYRSSKSSNLQLKCKKGTNKFNCEESIQTSWWSLLFWLDYFLTWKLNSESLFLFTLIQQQLLLQHDKNEKTRHNEIEDKTHRINYSKSMIKIVELAPPVGSTEYEKPHSCFIFRAEPFGMMLTHTLNLAWGSTCMHCVSAQGIHSSIEWCEISRLKNIE